MKAQLNPKFEGRRVQNSNTKDLSLFVDID